MLRWLQGMRGNMRIDKAIIYEAHGADPERDRFVRESKSGRLTIIATGDPGQVPAVARELADQGVELIELCGGISPVWRPKVSAAAGNRVRVSSVTFGVESLPAAAAYSAAYLAGRPPKEAYVFIEADADPDRDRFVKTFPPQHSTFIPVPDEATGARVAADLAKTGYGLIELYGGFSMQGAAAVIEAVNGRAPVGIGSFTLEATFPLR